MISTASARGPFGPVVGLNSAHMSDVERLERRRGATGLKTLIEPVGAANESETALDEPANRAFH